MKKATPGSITNPERKARRRLQVAHETVRVLKDAALAQVVSGCDTTSYTSEQPDASKAC